MRVYRVSRLQTVMFPALVLLFVVFYLGFFGRELVEAILSGSAKGWFLVVWFVLMAYGAQLVFRIPHEIVMRDDNMVEFRSLLGQKVVDPMEIKSLKRSGAFVNLRHSHGYVVLLPSFTGLYEFIGTLKSMNPEIKVKGL